MSSLHKNIWITLFFSVKRFFVAVWHSFGELFLGKEKSQKSYPFLREILEDAPSSYASKPTAVKLGRAIFVPIMLFFNGFRR